MENVDSSKISKENVEEKMFSLCGEFGRFQIFHFFMMNFFSISAGMISFFYVFAGAEVPHRCRLPPEIFANDSNYFPVDEFQRQIFEKFFKENPEKTSWENCRIFLNRTSFDCQNGWIFDRSLFGLTLTEEANLVCRKKKSKSFVATAVQISALSIFIFGFLADRFGRKKITVIVALSLFVLTFFNQIFLTFLPLTIDQKFLLVVFDQLVVGLMMPCYSLVFVLMLELTSSSWSSFTGNWALISFAMGEVLIGIFGKIFLDWRKLKWAETLFIASWIPYLYFMPESPSYFYSKGDWKNLEKILKSISQKNRREETKFDSTFENFLKSEEKIFEDKPKNSLKKFEFVKNLSICILVGFTTIFVYFKISFGLVEKNSTPFLSIFLGAFLESIGYVTSSILISSRLGRRGSLNLMLTIGAASLFSVSFFDEKFSKIFFQFAKFSISGAIGICWIFVPELFPTEFRNTANGIFLSSTRLAAIFAPIFDVSVEKTPTNFSFYFCASAISVAFICVFTLPETNKRPKLENFQN